MNPGTHSFDVSGTELLVESPILAVRRDQVVMPGGAIAAREVVEHFGAVAVVALDAQDRVALVRQYRRSVDQRLWELPAGILDIAGEDEISGARRELQEEAGLAAESWGVLVDLVTSPGFCDETVRVFLARDLRETERSMADDEEADMTMEWVELDKAVKMVMSGQIINSIAIAGIMTAAEVVSGRAQAREVDVPFQIRPTALAERRQEAGIVPDMKKIPR